MGVVVPHYHQREERHNGREYFVQLELLPNYGDNRAREFVSDDNRISHPALITILPVVRAVFLRSRVGRMAYIAVADRTRCSANCIVRL